MSKLVVVLCSIAAGCAVAPASDERVDVGEETAELRGGRARDDHEEIGKLYMKIDGKWSSVARPAGLRKDSPKAGPT